MRSPFRSERSAKYLHVRDQMKALGYHPLRPIFLDRYMQLRLIIVAVNHLATVLQRDPYRVYEALRCRAEDTVHGVPFTPNRQAKATAEGLREWETATNNLHIVCPYCHKDLLGADRRTHQEVVAELKCRTNATQSPTKA